MTEATSNELPTAPSLGANAVMAWSREQETAALRDSDEYNGADWRRGYQEALADLRNEIITGRLQVPAEAGDGAADEAGDSAADETPWQPSPGDTVLYAGEEDMYPATVLRFGRPGHREVLIRDDETGTTRWESFEDLEQAPARPAASAQDSAADEARKPVECDVCRNEFSNPRDSGTCAGCEDAIVDPYDELPEDGGIELDRPAASAQDEPSWTPKPGDHVSGTEKHCFPQCEVTGWFIDSGVDGLSWLKIHEDDPVTAQRYLVATATLRPAASVRDDAPSEPAPDLAVPADAASLVDVPDAAAPLADMPHEDWRRFHTAATGTDPGPADTPEVDRWANLKNCCPHGLVRGLVSCPRCEPEKQAAAKALRAARGEPAPAATRSSDFPWCDTCEQGAIWAESFGWLHTSKEAPYKVYPDQDTSGHEVTAVGWYLSASGLSVTDRYNRETGGQA